jgi:hypothetical protein
MATTNVPSWFDDNPHDPESAALTLIIGMCGDLLPPDTAADVTEILQDYCGVLQVEGAFAGLCWPDAKQIAAAVGFDVVFRGEDAVDALQRRARRASEGTDNMDWRDRQAATRAFSVAAESWR